MLACLSAAHLDSGVNRIQHVKVAWVEQIRPDYTLVLSSNVW